MHNSFYFIVATLVFVLVVSVVSLRSFLRLHRATKSSWEDLVKQLQRVDQANIKQIALSLIGEPSLTAQGSETSTFDVSLISDMVGGLKGLERLKRNSEVLIDLAAHLQRWYPEALAVAEELRLEAKELEWHVARLRGASKTGNLDVSFPEYAQHVIAIYYRMTQEMLAFCAQADQQLFVALRNTI